MDDPGPALTALLRAVRSGEDRHDVHSATETALLQTVVDAAATLFDAEAASIALFEPDPERLEFRVASGARGAGVVGLAVPPTRGVAGYVFSTGQPIALSDVGSDPRFDRATAERTGYVPRSIAAVPLLDRGSTLGVLQVLDKRDSATFTLRDMSRLGIFATQATIAIRASRVSRGTARLLRRSLSSLAESTAGSTRAPESGEDGNARGLPPEELIAAAAIGLDREDETPFWRLCDLLAGVRDLTDRELGLVAEILAVVTRRRTIETASRLRALMADRRPS